MASVRFWQFNWALNHKEETMGRLFLVMCVLFPCLSYADNFTVLVGYECNQVSNEVSVTYRGAYNEAGDLLRENKTSTQWTPWSLIESMENNDRIGTLKTIEASCSLSGKNYQILIGPIPGNMNIQGRCGAVMTAWAEIREGNTVLVPRREFESDCHDYDTPVTTDIILDAKTGRIEFKTISKNDFYM
ncbi:hypothetical protein [Vibrio nigripulchritudo]|nr:hypothetical protein [Vibrio nigripulchritudo]